MRKFYDKKVDRQYWLCDPCKPNANGPTSYMTMI